MLLGLRLELVEGLRHGLLVLPKRQKLEQEDNSRKRKCQEEVLLVIADDLTVHLEGELAAVDELLHALLEDGDLGRREIVGIR